MIGICTDSASQLSADLAARYPVAVVPLTVAIGDDEYLEGVDIDADQLYSLLGDDLDGEHPSVVSSEPSAGQFAAAYEELIGRGCTEVLSIHASGAECNTARPARLAARAVPVPVRVAQVATRGFGIACCVWAAAEAVADGASLDEVVTALDRVANGVGHVHSVNGGECVNGPACSGHAAALFVGQGSDVRQRACTCDVGETVDAIVQHILGLGTRLRVGVGMASNAAAPLAEALAGTLSSSPNVADLVRYRIGPGSAPFMSPRAVGCFAFPIG